MGESQNRLKRSLRNESDKNMNEQFTSVTYKKKDDKEKEKKAEEERRRALKRKCTGWISWNKSAETPKVVKNLVFLNPVNLCCVKQFVLIRTHLTLQYKPLVINFWCMMLHC